MKKISAVLIFLIFFIFLFLSDFYFKKTFFSDSITETINNTNTPEAISLAKVFSNYPFNTKNLIVLSFGAKQGVKVNDPVFWEGFLLGQIRSVADESSEAKTVFDASWQIPVRIGEKQIDGMFQGGSIPKIVMIQADKEVNAGDLVISVSRDFPYGIKLGELGEVEKADNVFKEGILKLPYNIVDLKEVKIGL